ncbi:hypothetical protein B0H19DRAFT_1272504 [Mycena capillaripes]|nr:hypothetical protein B0H19DRAFT_1383747 [Mycena capillaripes]KAJ6533102.1 hypothetical protein B0H19DRAFT_1272504 [Mycena capillaripes]
MQFRVIYIFRSIPAIIPPPRLHADLLSRRRHRSLRFRVQTQAKIQIQANIQIHPPLLQQRASHLRLLLKLRPVARDLDLDNDLAGAVPLPTFTAFGCAAAHADGEGPTPPHPCRGAREFLPPWVHPHPPPARAVSPNNSVPHPRRHPHALVGIGVGLDVGASSSTSGTPAASCPAPPTPPSPLLLALKMRKTTTTWEVRTVDSEDTLVPSLCCWVTVVQTPPTPPSPPGSKPTARAYPSRTAPRRPHAARPSGARGMHTGIGHRGCARRGTRLKRSIACLRRVVEARYEGYGEHAVYKRACTASSLAKRRRERAPELVVHHLAGDFPTHITHSE